MKTLPATDLGIMAEHLSAHEGVINKLEVYQANVSNTVLKEILVLQTTMMRAHVRIMLAFINPYNSGYIEVPELNDLLNANSHKGMEDKETNDNTKWIALEAHTTAKCLSNENYVSALMMKDKNVRNAHVEMALQQLTVQEKYTAFIKNMGWAFVPHVSVEDQVNTYQHFQYMLTQ
ncbi:hypothetical protein CFK37_03490 [Virgibacillus phasianinus]|uniref:Spore coat protein n=1 Tax=Virgibacillus phasianinus TaxID=2017483 RepID=A0A220U048_9BACI|nr:hypothetical protein [Virgibacillus phasianinus]ASK61306.1 hypothetical protein CFK37_03490 [Virgibacillus phasianinus]